MASKMTRTGRAAEPSFAGHPHDIGQVLRSSNPPSLADAEDHPPLGQLAESSMRGRPPALTPGAVDIAEEPTALIGHGGVCEGGGPTSTVGLPLLGD